MTKTVFQLRLSLQEKELWLGCSGGNLSTFIRRVMNEECEKLEAIRLEKGLDLSQAEQRKRDRVEELTAAFPQKLTTAAQIERTFRPDPK